MNLYGVLRILVNKAALPEVQQKDCLAALDEAERMNMLGTSAKRMDVQEHTCQYAPFKGIGQRQCIYCGEPES